MYDRVCQGIENRETSIQLSLNSFSMNNGRITDIMHAVQLDNPMFFYVNYLQNFNYVFSAYGCVISVTYLYSRDEEQRIRERITQIMNVFQSKYRCGEMKITQQILLFYKFIIKTTKYDLEAMQMLQTGRKDLLPAHINTICGPLLHKKDICLGIALTYKLFCDYYNIPCVVVSGVCDGIGHAWNVVCINQKYYHIDVTNDLNQQGEDLFKYEFFLLSDRLLSFGGLYSWDSSTCPRCSNEDLNFYEKYNLYVKEHSDIERLPCKQFANKSVAFFKIHAQSRLSISDISAGVQQVWLFRQFLYGYNPRTRCFWCKCV